MSVLTRYEQFAQCCCPCMLVDQDLGTEGTIETVATEIQSNST